MKIQGTYIHGAGDVRLRETELPALGDGEILLRVIASSMCYSTYKALSLGSAHKRVPPDVAEVPVLTGHEFAGIIEQVGSRYADRYSVGERVAVQPALGLETGYSPGYSYPFFGGDATHTIIPEFAIEKGCLLPYQGTYFADAALAEPMSCIIGAYHASYHTRPYVYSHDMGIKRDGNLALLGCAGPMGMGAIDYAINGPYSPKTIVVADVDEERLQRVQSLLPPSRLDGTGRTLAYVNLRDVADPVAAVKAAAGGEGFDDVQVYAVVSSLIETADRLLRNDGCLNFFAGPTDKEFSAAINFYNVHYESTHLVGTSGGSTADMQESLDMTAAGRLNPSFMVTHVGGLDAIPPTLRNFMTIPGGKKLFYPGISMPLYAIDQLRVHAETDPRLAPLADICEANQNVWNQEAEDYVLTHFASSVPAVSAAI